MTKKRELIPGDRVKIIGPWRVGDDYGKVHIGRFATVRRVSTLHGKPVLIKIDDMYSLLWDRENLRALPRRKNA